MATANAVILDTNVLVRYLVDLPGDELQCAAARKLVHAAGKAVVPITVCCELVWVLQSQPTVTKPVLIALLESLLEAGSKFVMPHAEVEAGLDMLRMGGDFADGVNAYCGRMLARQPTVFATFDKRAAKLLASQGIVAITPV